MSSTSTELQSDEELLRLTQLRRLGVVDCLINPTDVTPVSDPKVAKAVLTALDGIDKQILARMRLDVDNKSADTDRQMATLLSQIANQRLREGNPFKVVTPVENTAIRQIQPPPEIVDKFEFQDEEMIVKRSTGNYADFMARMDPIMAAKDE